MTSDDPAETEDAVVRPPPEISGRTVVLALLTFSSLMTASLFVYWELYTRPFRPLQDAIAARYPDSSPRVVAGRRKSHQPDSPHVLRVVLRTKADPRENESATRQQANELLNLMQQHADVSPYDVVEIHLMYRPPEEFTVTWSLKAPPDVFPIPLNGELPATAERTLDEVSDGN